MTPDFSAAELARLAARLGTPLYVYRRAIIERQLGHLRRVLDGVGRPWRIFYAMKANRHPGVLAAIREGHVAGIDACSPREVAAAREAGFAPAEISVTAGMLSNRDLAAFAAQGVHVNLDTFSAIRRHAAAAKKGARIGLRLDPGVAIGYDGSDKLAYGRAKFGLPPDRVAEAAAYARSLGLVVDTLHLHCGWNLPAAALPGFESALDRLAGLARAVGVAVVNVGGGLGVPFRPEDRPLSPEDWAAALKRHLGGLPCTIACEPGTFVAAPAGVLVVEVNTVERRGEIDWLGIDAGHNINVYPAHYGIPLKVAALGRTDAPARCYHLAGNINEPGDVFARDLMLPQVREGDLLALYPAGAYGSSMASDHCLRGWAGEVVIA